MNRMAPESCASDASSPEAASRKPPPASQKDEGPGLWLSSSILLRDSDGFEYLALGGDATQQIVPGFAE